MNQLQLNHKSMFETVYQTMQSNLSLWSSNAGISAAVTALLGRITNLGNAITGQLVNFRVVTQTKAQAKETLIALTMAHAAAGKGFGASSGNATLKGICKITPTQLERMEEDQLGNFCQTIYNAVSPVIGSLASYGVNSASLLQWSNAITRRFQELAALRQLEIFCFACLNFYFNLKRSEGGSVNAYPISAIKTQKVQILGV